MVGKNFIDMVISGEKELSEVEEFAESWCNDVDEERPLHECLGLSYEQYTMWILVPGYIEDVIDERRK